MPNFNVCKQNPYDIHNQLIFWDLSHDHPTERLIKTQRTKTSKIFYTHVSEKYFGVLVSTIVIFLGCGFDVWYIYHGSVQWPRFYIFLIWTAFEQLEETPAIVKALALHLQATYNKKLFSHLFLDTKHEIWILIEKII